MYDVKNVQKRPIDRFSHIVGHSRFIVLLAIGAVMLIAVSLFLLGTIQAVWNVWHAWESIAQGKFQSAVITVEFLEIVSVMLKAVFFYIVGVGLYSLFVAPLNITISLGIATLSDLEAKVVSVIVVILGVTFLKHFIFWRDPVAMLQFGSAMAVAVIALLFFQRYTLQVKKNQSTHNPDEQRRAQYHMFALQKENAHRLSKDHSRGANKEGV